MTKKKLGLNIFSQKTNNCSNNVNTATPQVQEEFKLPKVDPRGFPSRQSVYISKEVHHKISLIANILADRTITVGGLVDAILNEYIQQNGDSINEFYRKQVDHDKLW